MSVLREHTNAKHREAEGTPFVQYMLHGAITPEHYAVYLQQMLVLVVLTIMVRLRFHLHRAQEQRQLHLQRHQAPADLLQLALLHH